MSKPYRGDKSVLERLQESPLPSLNRICQDRADAATLIAELQDRVHYAEGTTALAIKHRDAAEKRVGDLQLEVFETQEKIGALLQHAEAQVEELKSSLHQVRRETIEECAKLAENLIFPVLPDQMTTRELIKAQRDQISARISSLNKTGLDSTKTVQTKPQNEGSR